ncbi:hypothetical protein P4B35_23200 [Pontiellaceae bacterium B12227]|nr:hypothetical protein [Pontiellaceae bacterium B12227]
MKKIIIAAALTACAAVVTAQTVTSANIVGYAKNVQPAGGFVMAAPAQFAGTAGGVTLDETFSGVVGGEQVYVYNGVTYDIYSYFTGYGWFDGGFAPAGGTVMSEGTSVWLTGAPAAETIMSGEVPSAASVTNAVSAGFNLISNPYPVALKLDDIDLTAFVGGEQVFVFNGLTYDIYSYFAGYGWFDGGFTPAGSVEIPVGQGFWLSMVGAGDLVFNKAF